MRLLPRMRSFALLAFCFTSCQAPSYAAPPKPKGPPPASSLVVAQPIFELGLKNGWMDYGWSDRKVEDGSPASVDLSDYGGWIIAKPGTPSRFGGLRLRYRAPPSKESLFDVRVEGPGVRFPRVIPGAEHQLKTVKGWVEIFISMDELNPEGRNFEQLVLQGRENTWGKVEFDSLAWTVVDPNAPKRAVAARPVVPVQLGVECLAPALPISPLIYGVAFDPMQPKDTEPWELGATARRWGGNPASRYNWQLGNAWNTGSDWYFRNVNYTDQPNFSYEQVLDENLSHKVHTALTVPLLGWVAKDTESVAFSTQRFGPQRGTDPHRPEAGDGFSASGKALESGPPTLTSVAAPPEFVAKWISTLREKDKQRGRSVGTYILDNEPMLWHETHRDVHPQRVSYDELMDRTVRYATAVRKADPEAQIAGPAEWGWTNYFYSSVDTGAGSTMKRPDRRAHGDLPLLTWYLQKLREHEQKTGVKLLDVLDLHYYPQGPGMGLGDSAQTDSASSALRIRATRSLWDPTYQDESWIEDKVQLIPRMKTWIAENYPGLRTQIGEYNFGAEFHMSGGLAQAEALGRFGQQGLYAAYFWDYPARDTPAFWAFRAYRNFDGAGARFEDLSLPTRTQGPVSLFASKNAAGTRLVLVALNLDPDKDARARIDLGACGRVQSRKSFQYTGQPGGFTALPAAKAVEQKVDELLPAYSISVFEVALIPRPKDG